MEVVICYAIMFCITLIVISCRLSVVRLKQLQRLRLLTIYTDLFFSAKLNYKRHEKPALFQNKEDFQCFKEAFKWLVPYVNGTKLWKEISDWDMGMLVEQVINATNKYPKSRITKYIYERILEIVTRSVVLLFPARINLFMHLANNKENKCIISEVDFTEIKREAMEIAQKNYKLSRISNEPQIKTAKKAMNFSYDTKFIDRFSLANFVNMYFQRLSL